MQFLGTAAADMIPNPFCLCPICEDARADIATKARKRSCFLLDDKTLIDFGPDISSACQLHGQSLCTVENIFITHTHEDHFCPSNFGLLTMSITAKQRTQPLNVYLSEKGLRWLLAAVDHFENGNGKHLDVVRAVRDATIRLHPVTPYMPLEAGDWRVVALETQHIVDASEGGERAINYVFTHMKTGQKLLYACDTGIYTDENFRYLAGTALDYVILEGTFGAKPMENLTSHLNAEGVVTMLTRMQQHGTITDKTQCYITHINHKHHFTHADYQAYLDQNCPVKAIIASDGLEIG